MKRLSSKMKILFVLSICVAMIIPTVASAGSILRINAEKYLPGHYTLEIPLTGNTSSVVFNVQNGDGEGNNVVSSVKITLLDGKGKVKEVVISPKKFNQREFSNEVGTIFQTSVNGLEEITLDLKVGGPKNSSITLTVTENYDGFPSNGNRF